MRAPRAGAMTSATRDIIEKELTMSLKQPIIDAQSLIERNVVATVEIAFGDLLKVGHSEAEAKELLRTLCRGTLINVSAPPATQRTSA